MNNENNKNKMVEKTNKNRNIKRTRLLRAGTIIFIIIGVALVLYPVYTNFYAGNRETSVLSAWEDQKEEYFEEIEAEKEISEEADNGQTSQNGSDDINISEENEDATMEFTGGIAGEANLDYADLAIEDFFPLKMLIPIIEIEAVVGEGTDSQSLKKGPGYEAFTPLPGDVGRSTISGHRTTYGAPFFRLDELENGDLIYLETINNELLTYMVTGMEIVLPTDVWILKGTGKKELILTTCTPKYSAARRLIIIAELLEAFPFEITHKN